MFIRIWLVVAIMTIFQSVVIAAEKESWIKFQGIASAHSGYMKLPKNFKDPNEYWDMPSRVLVLRGEFGGELLCRVYKNVVLAPSVAMLIGVPIPTLNRIGKGRESYSYNSDGSGFLTPGIFVGLDHDMRGGDNRSGIKVSYQTVRIFQGFYEWSRYTRTTKQVGSGLAYSLLIAMNREYPENSPLQVEIGPIGQIDFGAKGKAMLYCIGVSTYW